MSSTATESDFQKCTGLRRWLVELPTTLPRGKFPSSQDGFARFVMAHERNGGSGTADNPVDRTDVVALRVFIDKEIIGAGWAEWVRRKTGWNLNRTAAGELALGGPPYPPVEYPPANLAELDGKARRPALRAALENSMSLLMQVLACPFDRTDGRFDPRFDDDKAIGVDALTEWLLQSSIDLDLVSRVICNAVRWHRAYHTKDDRFRIASRGWEFLRGTDMYREPKCDAEVDACRIADLITALEVVDETFTRLCAATRKSLNRARVRNIDTTAHRLLTDHDFADRVHGPLEQCARDAHDAVLDAIEYLEGIAPCLEHSFGDDVVRMEADTRRMLLFLEAASERMPSVLVDETENEKLNAAGVGLSGMIESLRAARVVSVEQGVDDTDSAETTPAEIPKPRDGFYSINEIADYYWLTDHVAALRARIDRRRPEIDAGGFVTRNKGRKVHEAELVYRESCSPIQEEIRAMLRVNRP